MKKDSVLYGKKALFSGDSISCGSSDSTIGRAWAWRIAREYGLIAHNASRSGWSISTIRTGRMIDQLYNAPVDDYDYVILHGGVNDAWGDTKVYAPVGVMTDSFDRKDFDVTTYAGALEELFHYTYTQFPKAKVGYIINFATPLATGIGHVADMEEYYAVGMDICRKWGVPYLDLYHNETVNETVMEVTKQPFRYMADAVHPNAAGYERLYPIIGDWMETLTENQKPQNLIDTRSFVTVCTCDDPTAWQPTCGTQLSVCQTPDGQAALQLYGAEQTQHHVSGWQWIGAQAVCDLKTPVDLSDCKLIRFNFYLSREFAGKAGQLRLDLCSDDSACYRVYFGVDFYFAGWHEITFNLKDARNVHGNVDLQNIRRLEFTWHNHNCCMDDLTVAIGKIEGQK